MPFKGGIVVHHSGSLWAVPQPVLLVRFYKILLRGLHKDPSLVIDEKFADPPNS